MNHLTYMTILAAPAMVLSVNAADTDVVAGINKVFDLNIKVNALIFLELNENNVDEVIKKMEAYQDELEMLLVEIMDDNQYRSIDINKRREIVKERTREEIIELGIWDVSEKKAELVQKIIADAPQLEKIINTYDKRYKDFIQKMENDEPQLDLTALNEKIIANSNKIQQAGEQLIRKREVVLEWMNLGIAMQEALCELNEANFDETAETIERIMTRQEELVPLLDPVEYKLLKKKERATIQKRALEVAECFADKGEDSDWFEELESLNKEHPDWEERAKKIEQMAQPFLRAIQQAEALDNS